MRPLLRTAALVAALALAPATAATAQALSSAQPGQPMRPVAAREVPTFDSGLPEVAPSGPAGTLLAEVPLDPRVGLSGAARQLRVADRNL